MQINDMLSTSYASLALCTLSLAICSFLHFNSSKRTKSNATRNKKLQHHKNGQAAHVPFFYIPPSTAKASMPPFVDLYRILANYKDSMDNVISSIVLSQEIAQRSEWDVFPDADDDDTSKRKLLSSKLEDRISRTAEVLELDYFILQDMLKPFEVTNGLPFAGDKEWTAITNPSEEKTPSYDSAMQVITHIVRDWSNEGSRSRDSLYHWSILELMKHDTSEMPVLVPGSGLGRLAHDISLTGFKAEANELSICMSTAAYRFLNGDISAKGFVHPFAFDFLINEVNSNDRYKAIEFPGTSDQFLDKLVREGDIKQGSLSYTIGDFVEIYAQNAYKSQYGSVVTCFFIDTATNIFEYLLVIRNALKSGGLWINVGPLQWHQNAKVHPSADELKLIIESMGFQIESWSVDKEAINYRHDDRDEAVRHTKYEGYRPLRFVATLLPSTKSSLVEENVAEKIMRMRTRGVPNFQPSTSPSPGRASSVSHVTITELS
jgi:hypothetical protein